MIGVANQVLSEFGGWNPTGAFSLEVFRRARGGGSDTPLGEHFFVVGPQRISRRHRFKISAESTYGDVAVFDSGNDTVPITISGQIHAYHSGKVRTQSGDDFLSRINPLDEKAGYYDFFDLVWLIVESRDPDTFYSAKPSAFLTTDTAALGAFQIFARAAMQGLDSLNFEDVKFVYHDYDRGKSWEVVFEDEGLQIQESADAPFAWNWTLQMRGIRDVSGPRADVIQPIPNIFSAIPGIISVFDEAFSTIAAVIGAFADIAGIHKLAKQYAQEISASLRAFRTGSEAEVRRVRRNLGLMRDTNDRLEEQLIEYFLPGRDRETEFLRRDADFSEMALDPLMRDIARVKGALASVDVALLEHQTGTAPGSFYIKATSGATWAGLAAEYLGDASRAAELLRLNADEFATREPWQMDRVRIPAPAGGFIRSGILAGTPERDGEDALAEFLFGSDLGLDDTGDLSIGPSGDLRAVSGLDCLVEHNLDRLSHYRGTVPLHPEWGQPPLPGELADTSLLRFAARRTLSNLQQDPANRDVTIEELRRDGTGLFLRILFRPAASFEFRLENTQPRWRHDS